MLVKTQSHGYGRFFFIMGLGVCVASAMLLGNLLFFGSMASAAPRHEVAPAQMQPDDVSYPLQEGFESGTLGAFHSTIAACALGGCGWGAYGSTTHSGYFSAQSAGVAGMSDQQLALNGAISIPGGATMAQLSFWHWYSFQGPNYDGGVLEVSTNGGGTWFDVGAANITGDGYRGTIFTGNGNPLSGRQAWVGLSGSFRQVQVNLLSFAGQSILFRFRLGTDTDASTSTPGWKVDDIQVAIATSAACSPGTWSVSDMAAYPIAVDDQAVVALGGYIYSFGGDSTAGRSANAYRYDPTTSTWTAIASLPAGRAGASAVTDGIYIYIINGVTASSIQNILIRYDPATNIYSTLNPPVTATYEQTAQYVNRKIYRIGGTLTDGSFSNSVEAYNISTNAWQPAPDYPDPQPAIMSAAYGPYIFTASSNGGTSARTYRFDTTSGTWDDAAISDLPAGRRGAASGVLNGRWVLAGGLQSGSYSNSAIALDLNNPGESWATLPNLPAARSQAGGATVGQAFHLLGGLGATGRTNDNQRFFEVPCATFTSTPTPPNPHQHLHLDPHQHPHSHAHAHQHPCPHSDPRAKHLRLGHRRQSRRRVHLQRAKWHLRGVP